MFEEVKRGRVSDDVLRQLKKSIIEGVYKPGDKLPSEKTLMETFNVSRGSLREALRTLEELGFIIIKSGVFGGAFVLGHGMQSVARNLYDIIRMEHINLKEILQLRLILEPGLAALAARNRSSDDINLLEKATAIRESALKMRKVPIVVNIDFHQYVARASGNRMGSLILDAMALISQDEFKSISLSLNDHKAIVGFHKKILECIIKEDDQNASKLMHDHVLDTIKRLEP
jgi:GntR family transcriptional repressor for pyruvate dehydrogenase complex